mmetsp:Transcript_9615/g.20834  ORF Transcript_9615/g.20834 Transcript_9615/m.20834 type:complete len:253 (+) Transcript_9615:158-916(+)|eukprot:CAMPEP_0168192928 /NCGR_PEP_ID=MMETSP0139_2-20121125/18314_1 /TAXON_ID=44445 /ORGANISM="Pseudo-nitzschia australis, Strain 10249 10 AB" /LENGTH=252 /DNA_ID=CAMNT_0008116209 /DNA_START=50 /DNA_END=808 /DNA_ORIENTATION=-
MTLKKSIVFLITLAIARYDTYVGAWISKGSSFHPRLLRANHETENRNVHKTCEESCLGAKSKPGIEENENPNLFHSFSRRLLLQESHGFVLLTAATLATPFSASAKYGEGTSMELPSYIDYLIEKNTAAENSNALYTGADPATVLRRLADSESRLGEIRGLAEQKKWSQISGIITGPLGTLLSTMNQIVSIVSSSPAASPKKTKQVQDTVKKVKADIFAIGQAASKKDPDGCTKQAAMASNDLKILLEIAFD